MIISELAEKHNLPDEEVMTGVEVAIIKVLAHALRNPVVARIETTGELSVVVFHKDSAPGSLSVSDIPNKLQRRIFHEIEREMILRKNVYTAETLKDSLQGKVVEGETTRVTNQGALVVAVETVQFGKKDIWFAECPYHHIPPHERSVKQVGRLNKYLVSSVQAIANESDSRLRMRLSRTTPTFPPALLSEITGVPGIVCTKRIPGAYSDICSPVKLPKAAINEVGKEIRERLNVRFADKIIRQR